MIAERVVLAPRAFVATGRPRRRFFDGRRRFGTWLARMLRNHRTRCYLTDVDDHTLADLGISRAQANFEASRWMWDGA